MNADCLASAAGYLTDLSRFEVHILRKFDMFPCGVEVRLWLAREADR